MLSATLTLYGAVEQRVKLPVIWASCDITTMFEDGQKFEKAPTHHCHCGYPEDLWRGNCGEISHISQHVDNCHQVDRDKDGTWKISETAHMTVLDIDGLVQDCSISSALAMEMLQSCTKPSIYASFTCHIIALGFCLWIVPLYIQFFFSYNEDLPPITYLETLT